MGCMLFDEGVDLIIKGLASVLQSQGSIPGSLAAMLPMQELDFAEDGLMADIASSLCFAA